MSIQSSLGSPSPVPASTATLAAPPKFVEPYVQPGRTLLVVLVWIAAVVGAIFVVLTALIQASGAGATLSLTYAIIPVPAMLLMYWWIDRVEPEPFRYKAAAFIWGAVIATSLAIAGSAVFFFAGASDVVMTVVVAPVVEEATKGLFLLVVLLRARKIIHGVVDGMILAGLVGVGFAAVENVIYYVAAYFEGPELFQVSGFAATTSTFVMRGLISPLAHPLFTSMLGIAIGLAVAQKSWAVRILLVVGGYLGSVALHAFWNGSAVTESWAAFVVTYLCMAVLLLGLFVAIILLRIREMKSMRATLIELSEMGWLHPAEVGHLLRFSRRRQARKYAAQHGPHAAQAMKEYQKLATEVAFLHQLTFTGRSNAFSARQAQGVLEHMWTLRPWLQFPPALPPAMW